MSNSSIYISENKLSIPERLLRLLHSQLKLKTIAYASSRSLDSISNYLETYFNNEFRQKNPDLFHVCNAYGIGFSSANIERAFKGKKGQQKVNLNTEVSYELLNFLSYASCERQLHEIIFDPTEDWGDKTVYSITIPEYAQSEIDTKNKPSLQQKKASPEIKLFAQRIYIELTTRKAAIPIDEENDVIEDIYNSWYKLFCVIRDEMKTLPIGSFNDDESQPLIILSAKILNDVLRPHLTEHQAKYRSWLDKIKYNPKNKNFTPQELQKKYPDYINLLKSLKEVNQNLIEVIIKFKGCL